MDNKEFSKELEKRTRKFAVKIIQLSANLPNTTEGIVVRNQINKLALLLVQTTVKPTEQEVERIL